MGKPNNEPSKNLFMKLPNIIAKSREFINWFSPSHAPYPANESGDIMRRAMANNSWFDQISSSWESCSFWNKAATLIGLTLFSGVIGLFLNAPTLFAFSAGLISFFIHRLLVTHEINRFQHATLIVSETIAANASLQKSEALLKKTMTEYSLIQDELSKQGKQIQELSASLASKAQVFNQKIDSILPLIHDVQTETVNLNQQQKITTETLTTMNTALQAREQTITTATERVASIGQVTQQFSNDVVKIQQSQNELSQVVTQFSLFVNDHSRKIPPSAASSSDDSDTSIMTELKRQNAEDTALIREWTKNGAPI